MNQWRNYFLYISTGFTPECIILNNYKGPHSFLINIFIVTMKHYVYVNKCEGTTDLKFIEFTTCIADWYVT